MFFPEGLYTLSARDQQVTWLDPGMYGFPGLRSVTVAADGSISQQVPDGRCLILQSICAVFQGGAAITSDLRRVLIRPPVALTLEVWLREERTPGAAAAAHELQWQGSIVVPPLWFVQAYGEFSGGAANEIALNIAGMLVPVGNIQRV